MTDTTTHLNIPKPNPAADPSRFVDEELIRLAEAWDIIDAFLHALVQTVNQKAAAEHNHAMAAIDGLVDALNAKMAADRQFKLDDLTDVSGADAAPANYILVKSAGGGWVVSTALAALGVHPHLISEITGLAAELAARPDRDEVSEALDLLVPKDGSELTGGFTATSKDLGAAGASFTITPDGGNIQEFSNVGAVTISAPTATGVYTIILEIVNSATAGAVTLSGFSFVDGDNFTTTSGHAFHVYVTKTANRVTAIVKALQ